MWNSWPRGQLLEVVAAIRSIQCVFVIYTDSLLSNQESSGGFRVAMVMVSAQLPLCVRQEFILYSCHEYRSL